MEYTFSSLQKEIMQKLQELDKKGFFGEDKNLTIMDGFVFMPIQESVGMGISIGGRSIPTVVVIDNDTGRIWNLSLKHLVPRIEL